MQQKHSGLTLVLDSCSPSEPIKGSRAPHFANRCLSQGALLNHILGSSASMQSDGPVDAGRLNKSLLFFQMR